MANSSRIAEDEIDLEAMRRCPNGCQHSATRMMCGRCQGAADLAKETLARHIFQPAGHDDTQVKGLAILAEIAGHRYRGDGRSRSTVEGETGVVVTTAGSMTLEAMAMLAGLAYQRRTVVDPAPVGPVAPAGGRLAELVQRRQPTVTHTYAILEVCRGTFQEVRRKLEAVGYQHAFHEGSEHGEVIDMHGIALAAEERRTGGVSLVLGVVPVQVHDLATGRDVLLADVPEDDLDALGWAFVAKLKAERSTQLSRRQGPG
jgi:hypothetical protein